MSMILHIVREHDWQSAVTEGTYSPQSLSSEGFIHCSTREQLLETANALFNGQEGLVLLCIDPARVSAPIVYEDCYETGQSYPHIYGPLNIDALNAIIDFPLQEDGSFALPGGLEWLC